MTNQPLFSLNTTVCDHFVRLLNNDELRGGYGLKLNQAFYKGEGVAYESLRGFMLLRRLEEAGVRE
ncbi:hypothetical protein B0A55_00490 [Friedmanniomyces simplex]|uniref:Uncharacterized protein n=1 Tax=Friedmanniomyces simplex TaxID=329884 RepID=A0A4U0Y4Q2_9PEZI|nr:hypothetical protein B0A55_00490 [Friedmanniomyces simplex]